MDKLEFSIASEIGNIVKVENFIDYFSDVYHVEPDVFGKISLCVIEAVNNAILYGNKLDSSKYVKFFVYEEEKRLFVTVKDEGEGLIVIPLSFSSGALSIESKERNSDRPFFANTVVMAAVKVVLPWST